MLKARSILSLLFAAFLLAQWLQPLAIVVDFKLNQDYIIEVLCLNREKPELGCNGHCQLSKELREKSKSKQEGQQAAVFQTEVIPVFFHQAIPFEFSQPLPMQATLVHGYRPLLGLHCPTDIFHPPPFC